MSPEGDPAISVLLVLLAVFVTWWLRRKDGK